MRSLLEGAARQDELLSNTDNMKTAWILTLCCCSWAAAFAPQPRIAQRSLRLWQSSQTETSNIVKKATSPPAKNNLEPSYADQQAIDASSEYSKGFAIISFITLLNASLAPVWHTVFEGNGPPPLFLNAVVGVVAFVGLLVGGSFLDGAVDSTSNLAETASEKWSQKSFRGGMELGFWKGLGTCAVIVSSPDAYKQESHAFQQAPRVTSLACP